MVDTLYDGAMLVHKHDGNILKFIKLGGGLCAHDTRNPTIDKASHFALLQTVTHNESLYTQRQLQDAKLAQRIYELVGRPSHATFVRLIRDNLLHNCPITVADANRALQIYGTDVHTLRGKTTRETPTHVTTDVLMRVPPAILAAHSDVTLCIDIFYVDGIAFLGSISRNIRFVSIDQLSSRTIFEDVLPTIKRLNLLYRARGFTLQTIFGDDEFTSSFRDHLLALNGIQLNIAAANEHVPEIERAIGTLKERNRCTVSALPYQHYPKLFKLALIAHAAVWLNMFPHSDGISNVLSPRTLMSGVTADYKIHCRVPIGAYCEVHNEPDPSNTEKPRTSPAIALTATGNLQSSYYFMSLTSGKRLTRRRWTSSCTFQDSHF